MATRYFLDLVFEGEKLTEAAEGEARDLSDEIDESPMRQAVTHRDAERYRESVRKPKVIDLDDPDHQMQDVIDAYRWNHPEASRAVRRGIGFSRPGRWPVLVDRPYAASGNRTGWAFSVGCGVWAATTHLVRIAKDSVPGVSPPVKISSRPQVSASKGR